MGCMTVGGLSATDDYLPLCRQDRVTLESGSHARGARLRRRRAPALGFQSTNEIASSGQLSAASSQQSASSQASTSMT